MCQNIRMDFATSNAYIWHPYTHEMTALQMRSGRPLARGTTMEESLVNVEFLKSSSNYIARIQSELGGLREYRAGSFEEVLEQVIIDLQEEFEGSG